MSPAWMYKLADVFLVLMVGGAWYVLLMIYFATEEPDRTDKSERGEK